MEGRWTPELPTTEGTYRVKHALFLPREMTVQLTGTGPIIYPKGEPHMSVMVSKLKDNHLLFKKLDESP